MVTQGADETQGETELRDAWLARDPLPEDPVALLAGWLDQAFADALQPNPHAVALATVDPGGRPSVRMVLCNAIEVEHGTFTMYTNLESRKGRAIAANPRGAIVFYWGPHDRQARVEGAVELTPAAQCDAYFAGRPLDAKLGAWASRQSEPIASRAALLAEVARVADRFGLGADAGHANRVAGVGSARASDAAIAGIPRPPHWGGYTLFADSVELWVSRPGRIHDRARWTRSAVGERWTPQRLQP